MTGSFKMPETNIKTAKDNVINFQAYACARKKAKQTNLAMRLFKFIPTLQYIHICLLCTNTHTHTQTLLSYQPRGKHFSI